MFYFTILSKKIEEAVRELYPDPGLYHFAGVYRPTLRLPQTAVMYTWLPPLTAEDKQWTSADGITHYKEDIGQFLAKGQR